MKVVQPKLADYFVLPNPSLRAYFARLIKGQSDDYRPPFFEKRPREDVLADWLQEVNKLGLEQKYPQLFNYEMEMKSKVGPMSIQKPLSERLEDIDAYFSDVTLPSVPIPEEAIQQTIQFFSAVRGIRAKSRHATILDMRKSTNSGNPWFTKRDRVLNQTLASSIYREKDKWIMDTPDGVFDLTAILGWRGQEGGIEPDDVKQRVIWMMSFLLNLFELQYYQPAIKAIQAHGLIPAYVSMEAVDKEVTELFDTKGPNDLVICTDFKKFDQHFNRHMQSAARQVEEALFTHSSWWFRDIFPAKFGIPIICSEDIMFYGWHGMGSGSGGTNFDECLAHKSLQFEAAIVNHAKLNPHSMAYGDDGVLSYPGITVEQICKVYESHGQVMNPTKQYASYNDCVVLRRWHGTNYRVNGIMVGVYSTFRALGRLLAQERFYDPEKWSAEMVTLRALSILENCKWHPLFHHFIEFVIKGDKLRLGLAVPGFFERLESIARKAMREFEDFLGFTKTMQSNDPAAGIMQWEVVKYLMSKRTSEESLHN